MIDNDKKTILINGIGTVGNRVADVFLSLNGHNLLFVKRDVKPGDVKTEELIELQKRHGPIILYAAEGHDLDERIRNMETAGCKVEGSIKDAPWDKIDFVVDCTDARQAKGHGVDPTTDNVQNFYQPLQKPFALNGGSDPSLVGNRFFASIPGTAPFMQQDQYKTNNAMIVSCNTHAVTTLFVLLGKALDQDWERVSDIAIVYDRRHEDPGKGKQPPKFITTEIQPYHGEEIFALVPAVIPYLAPAAVRKSPVEHFHTVTIDVHLQGPIAALVADNLKYQISHYPRAIVSQTKNKKSIPIIDQTRIIAAAKELGIEDGDIPFAVYDVQQLSPRLIRVTGETPQRGIVAASNVDYARCRLGLVGSFDDTFADTNARAYFRGVPFAEIKKGMEAQLK